MNSNLKLDEETHLTAIADKIFCILRLRGTFDNLLIEIFSDSHNKPSYQNLQHRVNEIVGSYLSKELNIDLDKNQFQKNLQKLVKSGFLKVGVERVLYQVEYPRIEEAFSRVAKICVYKYFGVKPKTSKEQPSSVSSEMFSPYVSLQNFNITTGSFRPMDYKATTLEKISDTCNFNKTVHKDNTKQKLSTNAGPFQSHSNVPDMKVLQSNYGSNNSKEFNTVENNNEYNKMKVGDSINTQSESNDCNVYIVFSDDDLKYLKKLQKHNSESEYDLSEDSSLSSSLSHCDIPPTNGEKKNVNYMMYKKTFEHLQTGTRQVNGIEEVDVILSPSSCSPLPPSSLSSLTDYEEEKNENDEDSQEITVVGKIGCTRKQLNDYIRSFDENNKENENTSNSKTENIKIKQKEVKSHNKKSTINPKVAIERKDKMVVKNNNSKRVIESDKNEDYELFQKVNQQVNNCAKKASYNYKPATNYGVTEPLLAKPLKNTRDAANGKFSTHVAISTTQSSSVNQQLKSILNGSQSEKNNLMASKKITKRNSTESLRHNQQYDSFYFSQYNGRKRNTENTFDDNETAKTKISRLHSQRMNQHQLK